MDTPYRRNKYCANDLTTCTPLPFLQGAQRLWVGCEDLSSVLCLVLGTFAYAVHFSSAVTLYLSRERPVKMIHWALKLVPRNVNYLWLNFKERWIQCLELSNNSPNTSDVNTAYSTFHVLVSSLVEHSEVLLFSSQLCI